MTELSVPAGELPTEKEREFRCRRCHSRCTRSPSKDLEYGHAQGCPNRPEELRRYVDGTPYDPEDDPLVADPDVVAADGGDRRVD